MPPLAVDIDGTLTRPSDEYGIDPRVFDPLRTWPDPVVLATGKAFPYPIAIAHFVGIEKRVVAENGGVVFANDRIERTGDGDRAREVAREFERRGGEVGYGEADLTNRWRETEVAISLDSDGDLLREVAAEYDMDVVDTGYAYHVKSKGVHKGAGLERIADIMGRDPVEFVAIGDSENDAAAFELVDRSYAVANADEAAREAADVVLEERHADGFLAALQRIREREN